MAVIDLAPRFPSAVRGYDRHAVDTAIRAEAALLDALRRRIADLERQLAVADRGAPFRLDDATRAQAVRAAADLVADAWGHAREVVIAEDATAHLQRSHAASIVAAHLADVAAQAGAQERRAQAEADAMLTAAHVEAAGIRTKAENAVRNAHPLAERLWAEATGEAKALALQTETALHTAREALEADLMRRQTVADHALASARTLATRCEQESAAVAEHATRMHQAVLTQAQAYAADLVGAVAEEVASLEAESDLAMAELAEHMSTMSTQLTSARKTMSGRSTGPPRAAAEHGTSPEPALSHVAAPESTATVQPAAEPPAKVAKPRAARKPAQPRTRKTKPTDSSAPAAVPESDPAKPIEATAPATLETAARAGSVPGARPTIKIAAAAPSILRL